MQQCNQMMPLPLPGKYSVLPSRENKALKSQCFGNKSLLTLQACKIYCTGLASTTLLEPQYINNNTVTQPWRVAVGHAQMSGCRIITDKNVTRPFLLCMFRVCHVFVKNGGWGSADKAHKSHGGWKRSWPPPTQEWRVGGTESVKETLVWERCWKIVSLEKTHGNRYMSRQRQ